MLPLFDIPAFEQTVSEGRPTGYVSDLAPDESLFAGVLVQRKLNKKDAQIFRPATIAATGLTTMHLFSTVG